MVAFVAAAIAPDDAVILSIRANYNKAKDEIKLIDKEKRSTRVMESAVRFDVPGKGIAQEVIRFYFTPVYFGEQKEYVDYRLFFVSRHLKLAGKSYYEEYLYEQGELLFVLENGYDCDGNKTEKRFYYAGGDIYEMRGGGESWESASARLMADDYRHSFDNLIRNAKE